MYNLLKKIIYACTLASLYVYSPNTLALTYTVIDFKFSMQDPAFGDLGTPGGGNIVGAAPWGTIVEGAYQGTNTTNNIVDFTFFGVPVYVYTAATNQGAANTSAGSVTGGPAPTINLGNLTADMSSWFATWSGTEFLQGNNNQWGACALHTNFALLSATAVVTNNLDGTFVVDWNSCITGGAFNGQIGNWQLTLNCDDCPTSSLGSSDSLIATQLGQTTRTVTNTADPVVITSGLGVSPAGYTFTWTSVTGGITDTDGNQGSFTFNPNGLTPGNYVFNMVSNQAAGNINHRGDIVIKVVASAAGLDILDGNNNGIINEYDNAGLAATQLQAELSNGTGYIISSDKGTLKLGMTAFCAGKAARVNLSDITAYAGSNCTAITNPSDAPTLIGAGTVGYYDFEVHGLTTGEAVQIVIPLNTALPSNAVYRKFNNNGDNWGTFITGNGDLLASATATSTGVCPAVGSASYTNGLTAGDNCIQLTITDGGLNDADGTANGQVVDPGTIAQVNSDTEAQLSSGCSISGNPESLSKHNEWLLIAAFITWLGLLSYRRKKAAQ